MSPVINLDSQKKILTALLFFLVLRLGVAVFFGKNTLNGGDAGVYHNYALSILKDSSWLSDPSFTGHVRPPFYPLVLSLIYLIFGRSCYIGIYIVQAVLSALACYFIYRFAEKAFNKRIAGLACLWSGIYIFYLMYIILVTRETLLILLIIMFFYYSLLYFSEEKKKSRNFLFMLVLYFMLIHADSRYLFYLPFFALLFIFYYPFWRGLKKYFAFLSLTLLLMVPWTIRNYVAYDRFVLIDCYTSKYIEYSMLGSLFKNVITYEDTSEVLNENYPTDEERALIKQDTNPNGRIPEEVELIKNDVYPASGNLDRILFRIVEFWRPVRLTANYSPLPHATFEGRWSLRHNLSSLLCYGLLLPFMVFGIYSLIRDRNRAWILLLFPIAVQSLLHIFQYAIYRYRVPIDSFIIMVACYGMAKVYFLAGGKFGIRGAARRLACPPTVSK